MSGRGGDSGDTEGSGCVPEFPHPYPTFSLLNKPPTVPPPMARFPELWSIQLRWWHKHTPNPGETTCGFCTRQWPCESWLLWDDLLKQSIGIHHRHTRSDL